MLFLLSLCNLLIIFFPPSSQTEPKNICPVISAAVNYTSPASRIPVYFLLAFCSRSLAQTQKSPFVPQETFLSADTKTCQHTSGFILPHYETVPLRVMWPLLSTDSYLSHFFLTLPPPPPPPEIYEIGPRWERGLSTCSCRVLRKNVGSFRPSITPWNTFSRKSFRWSPTRWAQGWCVPCEGRSKAPQVLSGSHLLHLWL